jgi:RND family efflux transporter MFP subunit
MHVTPDSILVVLNSPELQQAVFDAQSQLQGAEAAYKQLQGDLQSSLLDRRATAATADADYQQAKVQADTDSSLAKKGLVSQLDLKLSETKAEGLASRDKVEQQRYQVYADSLKSQLAVQQAKVEQARALLALKQGQLAALQVRAGITGVITDLPIEVGQRVTAGTVLAKVVQPDKLKADLKIAETQAKDIALNQPAEVDTHNGVIPGHVIRVDTAAVNGTVDVDVALDGQLPPGVARPDLSVEGTINLERLTNILYVGRPAFGQDNTTVSMFKLLPGGKEAVRVPVKLGRTSVSFVEILNGLNEGDQVILSDMSQYDAYNRIRLNR